jgi:hypothetical protein
MSNLQEIGLKYKTDKATHHKFCDVYEVFLKDIKNNNLNFLEIGVLNGASLKMWEEYLPNSNIYGADIYDKSFLNNDRIKTFILNQEDEKELNNINMKFDIIVDDGGHTMLQQQITLKTMINKLNPGGIYILEDLHTSNLDRKHGYGNTEDNNTLRLINDLKDKELSNGNNYFINKDDFHKIISFIDDIEIFETIPGSITSVIKVKQK